MSALPFGIALTCATLEPYRGGRTVCPPRLRHVSKSDDQDPAAQVRALEAAGCRKIFRETASGGRWDRPELHRLLDQLREGDVVVVWKLDRLSRSLKDTLAILEKIEAAEAGFRSLPRRSTPPARPGG